MDGSLQDSLGRPVEEEYDLIVATGGELNRVETRSLEEDLCNLPSTHEQYCFFTIHTIFHDISI